jgi:hypothetical protein
MELGAVCVEFASLVLLIELDTLVFIGVYFDKVPVNARWWFTIYTQHDST